jgi:sphingomyelin phosphodiesterase acid-like 3
MFQLLSVTLFFLPLILSKPLSTITFPPSSLPPKIPSKPLFQNPSFSFFHITDIHFDPLSNPVLYNVSTFCRPSLYMDRIPDDWEHKHTPSVFDHLSNTVPNYYGRYGCDTTEALLNSTIEAMVEAQPHPDFIIFTGDSPAHKLVWDEQIEAIQYVAAALNNSFPGVPIIPSIGNNDIYPDYNLTCNDAKLPILHNAWQSWIPSSQSSTFLQMGAFAVSPQPSLLVISLNTILYSMRNQNGITGSDPCGQFAWVTNQLENARSNGMTVYITGHILPGMDPDYYIPLWQPVYTSTFIDLVLSYSDVIGGMFFGHVHRDEFRVFNPPTNSQGQPTKYATSLVTGSSFSPIYDNNPSFRLYSYDKTYTLLDYNEIYIDLYVANIYGVANWTVEYSYSDYGEGPIGTASLSALFSRLQTEPALFAEWYDRRVAQYQASKQAALCIVSNPDTQDFNSCMSQGTK